MPKEQKTNPILTIVKEVRKNIKSGTETCPPVVSLHDILSLQKVPYFVPTDRSQYVGKYGEDKVCQYEGHMEMLKRVRAEACSKTDLKKDIPAPLTTKQIAITLCGFGECGETSARAAIDLILKFKEMGYNIPVTAVVTLGKSKNPLGNEEQNFYNHSFVIIGEIPKDFEGDGLSGFNKLKNCIFFDPSLGIIGEANQTETLLKDMVRAYGIDRLSSMTILRPFEHGETAVDIFKNAEEISNSVKRKLHLPNVTTPVTKTVEPVLETTPVPTLLPGQIRFFDAARSTEELLKLTNGAADFLNGSMSKLQGFD